MSNINIAPPISRTATQDTRLDRQLGRVNADRASRGQGAHANKDDWARAVLVSFLDNQESEDLTTEIAAVTAAYRAASETTRNTVKSTLGVP